MKETVLIVLIAGGLSFLLAASSSSSDISTTQQKSIQDEVLKVQEKMKAAAENFDANELFKYVLDVNDVIIENGQLRSTKKDAFDITSKGLEGIKKLTYSYSHKNIKVISSTTALWTAEGTARVVLEDGRSISRDFAETIVFVLQGGQWKVLHAHRSSPN